MGDDEKIYPGRPRLAVDFLHIALVPRKEAAVADNGSFRGQPSVEVKGTFTGPAPQRRQMKIVP